MHHLPPTRNTISYHPMAQSPHRVSNKNIGRDGAQEVSVRRYLNLIIPKTLLSGINLSLSSQSLSLQTPCTTDDIEDMSLDVYALPGYGLVLVVMALIIHAFVI
ncbi:hypothetical protein Tco_0659416 [Tanacetum coccineum]